MQRIIAQLSMDRTHIEKIMDYDLKTEGQLIDYFKPETFSLLIDVTGMNPKPEVGWLFDGRNFQPPPNPVIELEKAMHDYVAAHYGPEWQNYLIMIYNDPDVSEVRKAAALAAGKWVKSVVDHFKNLALKAMTGQEWTADEIDWPKLFDDSDPKVTLFTLPD